MTLTLEVRIAFEGTTKARRRRTKTLAQSSGAHSARLGAVVAAIVGGNLCRVLTWLLWGFASVLPHILNVLR